MFKKIFFVLSLICCASAGSFSQDSLKVRVDSVLKSNNLSLIPPDSLSEKPSKMEAFGNTMAKVIGTKKIEPDELPRIAFIRSMIVPGTGQITNKQYWKAPVIYVAAGVSVYFITTMNRQYHSYLSVLEQMKIDNTTSSMIKINGELRGPYTKEGITNGANQTRRYRDLNIIVLALGWTLFAVEANVAAHLKTFDMSEDISLKISPTIQQGPMSASLGAKFQFNLK